MLESAEELRSAQERILGGEGGAHELTALAEQHADALHALMSKAPGLLDRDGRTPSGATLERAGETVRAIPLDDDARLGFAAGRLTREHRAAGLGFFGSTEGSKRSERTAKVKPSSDERTQARAALAEAKARLRAQAKEVAEHEQGLRRAEREVEAAQRRRDDAAVALERARAREAEVRELVDEADAAAKRLR